MLSFGNITPTNGFDVNDLNNARQNNYAWSIAELEDYIYIGTGRNIPLLAIKSIQPLAKTPALITPNPISNLPEIWRYKKDGSMPWERVFRAPSDSGLAGFRYMISYNPNEGSPVLIAAGFGKAVQIYKSTNGVNWFYTPSSATLQGSSSRAMVIIKDMLYVATVDENNPTGTPYLYRTKDPEFYEFENVIDVNNPSFDPNKNPKGAISNMVVFNKRLYVGVSSDDGCQVWRSNKEVPEINDWTLIVDNGFGDKANKYVLSMGVFKNHVYVSGTKPLPLSWAIPMGCDIIMINKYDKWQLVVGGPALIKAETINGTRGRGLSGYRAGFNNPFNVYAWQIQEYNDKLLISTFDDSSNMEVILDTILLNKIAIENLIGKVTTAIIIGIYEEIIKVLRLLKYPFGFDLYESTDGVNFYANFKNGLGYPGNYGGRLLFVDSCNRLYLGTANPFQGCQVWKAIGDNHSCYNDNMIFAESLGEREEFTALRQKIGENFKLLEENMPTIMKFMPEMSFHNFI